MKFAWYFPIRSLKIFQRTSLVLSCLLRSFLAPKSLLFILMSNFTVMLQMLWQTMANKRNCQSNDGEMVLVCLYKCWSVAFFTNLACKFWLKINLSVIFKFFTFHTPSWDDSQKILWKYYIILPLCSLVIRLISIFPMNFEIVSYGIVISFEITGLLKTRLFEKEMLMSLKSLSCRLYWNRRIVSYCFVL